MIGGSMADEPVEEPKVGAGCRAIRERKERGRKRRCDEYMMIRD